jgi:hypothetical protein
MVISENYILTSTHAEEQKPSNNKAIATLSKTTQAILAKTTHPRSPITKPQSPRITKASQ